MPKGPILERVQYFAKMPGQGSVGVAMLDWNVVETSLGTMVEPRTISPVGLDRLLDVDIFDAAPNRIVEINEDTFYTQYSTSGNQLPRDFNR
jgi:hypothetical protein